MSIKNNYKEFQYDIEARGIGYLIHFTPTINLYSVLEHQQLMSRAMLESLDVEQFDILDYAQFTDAVRYDDKNYINLSVSKPNSFLFSRFRERTSEDCTINWCVLKINTKHIYDSDTLFSVSNAASSASKNQYGISGDLEKFKCLFSEELNINGFSGVRNLTRNNILPKYPTDVQAEILVKDTIQADSIINVCFETEEKLAEAKAAMIDFDTSNFIVDPEIFSNKRDR